LTIASEPLEHRLSFGKHSYPPQIAEPGATSLIGAASIT
jgi:hypothetical protein